MPKFSFPIPGRKNHKNKDSDRYSTYVKPVPSLSAVSNSSGRSKAQRFFGTDNDIYIDSPTRDDDSWMVSSSRSSVMSISISESTRSTRTTDDTGSVLDSQADKWDMGSGIPVFPEVPGLNGKASSTILGIRYTEGDGSVTTTSARLRNEDSSSTLKSFYDRQSSPLAISQQTSASSSRDLALRKGLPKVIPASPLLHVESAESLDSMVVSRDGGDLEKKGSRKKPAKLDFSMLFPKPGRFVTKSQDANESTVRPSTSLSTGHIPSQKSGPRKLLKAMSKESLRSQKSARSSYLPDPKLRQDDVFNQSQSKYAQSPVQRVPMDLIPESLVPERRSKMIDTHLKPPSRGNRQMSNREQRLKSASVEMSSSRVDPHSILTPPRPWDDSSAASISSNNTKGSKRTNDSTFPNTDLQQKSVLSLSSDSEGEDSDLDGLLTPITPSEGKAARILNGSASTFNVGSRPASQQLPGSASRVSVSRKRATQIDQFPTIPETSLPNNRLSEPWEPQQPQQEEFSRSSSAKHSIHRSSVRLSRNEQQLTVNHLAVPKDSRLSIAQPKDPRKSTHSDKRISRKTSLSSQRSLQPTPPLSPSSVEFRADPEDSNRFMAVTKQEEALLAALRQKRAKMREKIIEEHETAVYRSPPHTAEDIKSSFYTDANSSPISIPNQPNFRESSPSPDKQTVLMFLESPINEAQRLYTAEPSPDLSDFLGIGSDEETTPRTSWVAPRKAGKPRPDSSISPGPRLERLLNGSGSQSGTPNSAARLSAVGVSDGFREKERERVGRTQSVRKKTSSVRFKEDVVGGVGEDEDDGVVWGL